MTTRRLWVGVLGGVVALSGLIAAPAASAAAALPLGDLTGDGTVDSYSFEWDAATDTCPLVVLPADTTGPFAGHQYPLGDYQVDHQCPHLVTVGRVRGDGSSELFFDSDLGGGLHAVVRGADGFGVERADTSTEAPDTLATVDTNGDGRDDAVVETSGSIAIWYANSVGPDGHFTGAYQVPSQKAGLAVTVASKTVAQGAKDSVHASFTIDPDNEFAPSGTVSWFVDGTLFATQSADDFDNSTLIGPEVPLPAEPPGQHTIRADYSGDQYYSPDTATTTYTVTKVKTKAATSVSAKASGTAKIGTPTTITVTVANKTSGAGTPTGLVVLLVDGRSPHLLKLSGGKAVTHVTFGSAGRHTLQVAYSGDGSHVYSVGAGAVVVGR
jgi:hypothetical protein